MALVAAFGGAYILRVSISHRPISESVSAVTYLEIFLLLLPFWILIFALMGLYNSSIYEKRFVEAGRLLVGSFLGLLFITGVAYFHSQPIFPARLVPIYGFVLAFLFLLIFRNLARAIRSLLFSYDIGITNILVVGSNKLSAELIELLNQPKSGYRVIGIVAERAHPHERPKHVPVLVDFEAAAASLGTSKIHSIVQTQLYADNDKNDAILNFAQHNHIAFRFIPANAELFVGNIKVELFRSSLPVVAVHQTALIGWGRVVKRIFDVIISSILLVVFSPLILLIILLEIVSGGDVFFRQTRLTRFNNPFKVYKFRTVKTKYNELSPEQAFAKMARPELSRAYRDNGDYLPDDPRYGRMGNFLRGSSLDELPQLLNVLKGDISLVGPRALVPQELSVYEKRHTILSVKSGLTGLAQVSGRRNISFEERRKLDMFYVQNWSFWMDLVILIKTIRAVLGGFGAK